MKKLILLSAFVIGVGSTLAERSFACDDDEEEESQSSSEESNTDWITDFWINVGNGGG